MNYIGEHLLPGQLGHFFAVLSLSASLVATLSFYFTGKTKEIPQRNSWLRIARGAFFIETISVVSVIACIYYILANHLFEYKYAWEHSDKTLQLQYVFSCLWEGQEGQLSFVDVLALRAGLACYLARKKVGGAGANRYIVWAILPRHNDTWRLHF